MDENTKTKVKKVEEPETPAEVEVPAEEPKEETPEETPETPPEPVAEEPVETPAEPELTPAQSERVEEAKEKGMSPLKIEKLIANMTRPKELAPTELAPDFRDKLNADDEAYRIIESETQRYGQDLVRQAQAENQFYTWQRFLKIDEGQVESKFPELNPQNQEKFNPALTNAMRNKYLRFIGYQPGDPSRGISPTIQSDDISYADFVEAEMEFADTLAAQKTVRATENIARQAANTGLRPDGSSEKPMDLSKDPSQMTYEELLSASGAGAPPRDSKGRFVSLK